MSLIDSFKSLTSDIFIDGRRMDTVHKNIVIGGADASYPFRDQYACSSYQSNPFDLLNEELPDPSGEDFVLTKMKEMPVGSIAITVVESKTLKINGQKTLVFWQKSDMDKNIWVTTDPEGFPFYRTASSIYESVVKLMDINSLELNESEEISRKKDNKYKLDPDQMKKFEEAIKTIEDIKKLQPEPQKMPFYPDPFAPQKIGFDPHKITFYEGESITTDNTNWDLTIYNGANAEDTI